MRNLINFIIVLAIGLIIGGVSSQMLIRESHGIGAIQVGPWSAWPFVGGEEVDPYTVARATADGTIPLGAFCCFELLALFAIQHVPLFFDFC